MARTARLLSDESADKLAAALICFVGKWKRRDSPTYTDECWAWFEQLTADQQDTVRTLIDVIGSAYKGRRREHGRIAAASPEVPAVTRWFSGSRSTFKIRPAKLV